MGNFYCPLETTQSQSGRGKISLAQVALWLQLLSVSWEVIDVGGLYKDAAEHN